MLITVGVILVGAVAAFAVLVSVTRPKAPNVSTTHFSVAQYVPQIPHGSPMGVPIRGIDPGFMGWSTQLIGNLRLCTSQHDKKIWVALVRSGHVTAGQFVNAHGGFSFGFEWPDLAVNGGPPVVYTVVASTGASASVQLAMGRTTYIDLPAGNSC
jgi:hypothetical protein